MAGKALQREVEAFYGMLTEAMESDSNLWKEFMRALSPATRIAMGTLKGEAFKAVLRNVQSAIAGATMTTAAQAQTKLEQTGLAALFLSTGTHAVAVAIQKVGNVYRIARANKGDGSEPYPGIHIHECSSVDLSKLYPKVDLSFFTTHIHSAFGVMGKPVYLPQKYQKIGNCSIANSNGGELALLYLSLEPLVGHDVALEIAQAVKKRRCDVSRTRALRRYLDFYERHPYLPLETHVLTSLLKKRVTGTREDRQRRKIIQELLDI
jgi:hypothetical protein